MQTPVSRAALAYMAHGWAPTPVRPRSKAPLLHAWPKQRLGVADLHLFSAGCNLGLVLGPPSGALVDVDCDWPEAAALARDLLPATGLVHGRSGNPHSHFWYQSAAASTVFGLEAASLGRKPVIVELRGAGRMTVVPPSIHPSGEPFAWERFGHPALVSAAQLCRAVGQLAAAALLHALGWQARDALAFVIEPAEPTLADLERRYRTKFPLRSWLSGSSASGRARSARPVPVLRACRASRLTERVLAETGGVVAAASLLGLALHEGRQACPFHADSGPRSLQITGNLWRCWAGCGGGTAIHLASRALGVPYLDARDWLAQQIGVATGHGRSVPRAR